mgnify:CR=1 FL=1
MKEAIDREGQDLCMIRYSLLLLVCIVGVFIAGCLQEAPPVPMISPTPTTLPAIAPQTQTQEIPKEENQSTEPIQAAPVTVPPTHTAIPTPQITAGPTDPNRAFRDLVITKLDLMQDGKKAVLAAWDADDPTQAQSKIQELYHLIRNNNDASSFPKKMDYVRLNYYDYIDRMTQCAENFKQAAEMRERGENGSAQSYASAGIIAGDRADISDKRIRTFLRDHPSLL